MSTTLPKNQPIFPRSAPKPRPRLTGEVVRVVEKPYGQGTHFFFIESGGVRYFATIKDVKDRTLPAYGSVVTFEPLTVANKDKCDIALNVEIVSAPA